MQPICNICLHNYCNCWRNIHDVKATISHAPHNTSYHMHHQHQSPPKIHCTIKTRHHRYISVVVIFGAIVFSSSNTIWFLVLNSRSKFQHNILSLPLPIYNCLTKLCALSCLLFSLIYISTTKLLISRHLILIFFWIYVLISWEIAWYIYIILMVKLNKVLTHLKDHREWMLDKLFLLVGW